MGIKRKYTPEEAVVPKQIPPELWIDVCQFLPWKDLWALHFVSKFFFTSIPLMIRRNAKRWQGRFIIFRKHHDCVNRPYFPLLWPLHISFEGQRSGLCSNLQIREHQLYDITQRPDVNVQRFTFMDCYPPANTKAYKDVEIVLVDRARFPPKDPDLPYQVPQHERLDVLPPKQAAFQGAKRLCFIHDTVYNQNMHECWELPARMPCLFNNRHWNRPWHLTDICDLTVHTTIHGGNVYYMKRVEVSPTEPLHITLIIHNLVLTELDFTNISLIFICESTIPLVFHFKFNVGFDYGRHFVPVVMLGNTPSSITFNWPRHVPKPVAPFVRVGNKLYSFTQDILWTE